MREIQQIRPDGWEELEAVWARWATLEKRAGYPDVKRRYRADPAADDTNTLVIEIERHSFAAMEAANERSMQDPELAEVEAATDLIAHSVPLEFYSVLS